MEKVCFQHDEKSSTFFDIHHAFRNFQHFEKRIYEDRTIGRYYYMTIWRYEHINIRRYENIDIMIRRYEHKKRYDA